VFGVLVGQFAISHEDRLSFVFFDLLQKQTQLPKQDQVALVVVDQNALNQLNEKKGLVYPFPRELFGAVAKVAGHFSSRAIFYDILFTEPSFYGVSDDENFSRLMKESNVPVILPDRGPDGSIRRPVDLIVPAVRDFGLVSSKNDIDGVFRKYLDGNSVANVASKVILNKEPQTSPDYLHYYKKNAFPHKNLYEILATYDELEDGVPVTGNFSDFRNKMWIVGYSAPGLLDLKPTPIDPRAPGFIIPATGVANALSGHGIYSVQSYLSLSLLLLSVMFSILVIKLTRSRSWTFVALGGVAVVIPTLLSTLFWTYNIWVAPVPLFFAILSAGGSELLFIYQTVWREQSRMANAINHSMSPDMVDLVRSGQVKVSRFGELKPVTVLFSDLMGFTELSERLTPQDLVEVLNGYFDEVVNLVTTGHGYVDKFIGDAVMAFWGAPISQDNHSQLAFQVAANFHRAAERYNEKLALKFPGLPSLGTRVGLHSGTAVVGNIGARHRHNYTAIGDTVNVAARLESLCQYYGVLIVISESVVQESGFKSLPEIVELDHVVVKGKKVSTRIYTLVSANNFNDAGTYRKALALYYSGEWDKALELFDQCRFAPSRVMRDRCRLCRDYGIPATLENGVWSFETK